MEAKARQQVRQWQRSQRVRASISAATSRRNIRRKTHEVSPLRHVATKRHVATRQPSPRARQIIIAPCPHAPVIGLEPSHTRPTRASSHLTNFSKQDSRQPTHPQPSIPAIRAPSPHAHESVATLSCTPSQSRCHWSVDERTDGRTISGWCTDAECSSVQCADTGSAECADAGGCLSIKTSIGRQLRANSVCVNVHMGACAWERMWERAHGASEQACCRTAA